MVKKRGFPDERRPSLEDIALVEGERSRATQILMWRPERKTMKEKRKRLRRDTNTTKRDDDYKRETNTRFPPRHRYESKVLHCERRSGPNTFSLLPFIIEFRRNFTGHHIVPISERCFKLVYKQYLMFFSGQKKYLHVVLFLIYREEQWFYTHY